MFDRYSNCFIKIYFDIPEGRENEIARKVLIKHLTSGNSYGIQMKEKHCKFPQPELGPWVENSRTVGTDWKPPVLEGWERRSTERQLPGARRSARPRTALASTECPAASRGWQRCAVNHLAAFARAELSASPGGLRRDACDAGLMAARQRAKFARVAVASGLVHGRPVPRRRVS